ncbi:hypothetical protein CBER1_09391 [Cercospora berteroae]|uniref:Uncharacterized protein n=1 Tax=Cercospora berteroae TaxID=357750 RepID=A0A2S6C903_9PEZI|nr:hypothetical protein CBER1_09391 [Cercospora berteroae]
MAAHDRTTHPALQDPVLANATDLANAMRAIATLPLAIWEGFDRLLLEGVAALQILEALNAPIKAGKALPEQAEVALAGFERALLEEFEEQSAHIMTIILCSNTFRQYYTGTQHGMTIINTLGKGISEKDPLFYHLCEMSRYNERLKYPAAYHLGMIEHIVESSKAQADRVDRLLLSALSGLVAINGVLTTIRLHRPRNQSFEQLNSSLSVQHSDVRRDYLALSKMAQAMDHHLLYGALEDFLCLPPLPRSLNKSYLQIFDKSHKAMQRFWQAVHDRWSHGSWGTAVKGVCGALGFATVKNSEVISFSTTAAYLEGVAIERRALVDAIDAQGNKAAAAQAEAAAKVNRTNVLPQEVWGRETAETFRPLAEKSKSKTRPSHPARIASDQDGREVTESTEAVKRLAVLRIEVNKASYDIFQQMYGNKIENQSDTKWEDFTAAMKGAGFSAIPSGGSVFTFKSARRDLNFHRPHPDPSIDPIMLRIMGRRLNKWFEFDKDTFVEREKVEASKEQSLGQLR